MTKDYYKILDISEFSTQDEIKSAYRKLARKWHPDVAGNSADVISKFKEINEAYEILSNSAKKADYDTAKRFYDWGKNKNNNTECKAEKNTTKPNDFKQTKTDKKHGSTSGFKGFSFNWEDFIAKKYRETCYKKEKEQTSKRGNDVFTEIEISVSESITGTEKIINMLQTDICPHCNGRKFVNGSVCKHCNGKGEKITHKRFSIKIPAGIKNGSKIRLAGEGESGTYGGRNGDLYLTVNIVEQKGYKTDGLNILQTVTIAPHEAVLGTSITVKAFDSNVTVKISPNTKNGQKIKLSNCGIRRDNRVGDMILTVEIQIPTSLTNEEIELYKKLRDLSSSNINY